MRLTNNARAYLEQLTRMQDMTSMDADGIVGVQPRTQLTIFGFW